MTSPGQIVLNLKITNGRYSNIEDVVTHLVFPPELTVRSLPTGCTKDGSSTAAAQALTCVWGYATWGTLKTFAIPVAVAVAVAVASDLPAEYRINIADYSVAITSPYEPAGSRDSWTGASVANPYFLTVSGGGLGPQVDMAVALGSPLPSASDPSGVFARDELISFSASFSNLASTEFATKVSAISELTGPSKPVAAGTTIPLVISVWNDGDDAEGNLEHYGDGGDQNCSNCRRVGVDSGNR